MGTEKFREVPLISLISIVSSELPVCSGAVYQVDSCLCHMDQCLEAVRWAAIGRAVVT